MQGQTALCDPQLPVQTFYPWASLTTRLWRGAEHIEVEWTVGPIPFKDGLGREIVVWPHTSNDCNAPPSLQKPCGSAHVMGGALASFTLQSELVTTRPQAKVPAPQHTSLANIIGASYIAAN